jgi:hypothetical protein
MFWAIWKTRNKSRFDNIMPTDRTDIIFLICRYINYWCDLQKPNVRETLERGSELVKQMIQQIFNKSRGWAPLCRRTANS